VGICRTRDKQVEGKLPHRRVACRHVVITDRRSSNLFCMSLKEY
jgi:hypothetical protein